MALGITLKLGFQTFKQEILVTGYLEWAGWLGVQVDSSLGPAVTFPARKVQAEKVLKSTSGACSVVTLVQPVAWR